MDYSIFVEEFLKHVKPGDFVLNTGCKTGEQSLAIARRGFDVIGVDSSTEAITKAQRNARLESLPVKFKTDLAEFKDGTFDTCFASGFEDISEMARVLRKGAVLFLITTGTPAIDKYFSITKEKEYTEKQEHKSIVLARKK